MGGGLDQGGDSAVGGSLSWEGLCRRGLLGGYLGDSKAMGWIHRLFLSIPFPCPVPYHHWEKFSELLFLNF